MLPMIIIKIKIPEKAIINSVFVTLIFGAELITLAKIKIAAEIISAKSGASSWKFKKTCDIPKAINPPNIMDARGNKIDPMILFLTFSASRNSSFSRPLGS